MDPERSRGRAREREGGLRSRHHGHASGSKPPEKKDASGATAAIGEGGERTSSTDKGERKRAGEDRHGHELSANPDVTRQLDFMRMLKKQSAQRRRLLMKEVAKCSLRARGGEGYRIVSN